MLELIGLHRRFGDTVALDGVSFTVPSGALIGFVGRNGAGKTTAMRIAMGVLQADAGEVRFRGEPVGMLDHRRFGYMPEERGLYPRMRVLEQLAYLGRLHGLTKDDASARGRDLFARLQVEASLTDRVEALSLGNQQRVQLAAAMIHAPEVLVLDEPFSGLDPTGVDVLADVLLEEARGRGVPVVFSSHQLDLVERLCDGVVLIDRGRIVANGTIAALRRSRSRDLLQIDVAGAADRWWEVVPGAALEEQTPGGVVLALSKDADPQRLLDVARAQGDVTHFARVEKSLAELFREFVDEDTAA
ncbi:MAG: ATP-binding cassette domain-containing protein [Actinomycetota bacterium]